VTPEPNDRCQSKKAVGLPRALETGGLMPRCLRSPSPALNSTEHAELAPPARQLPCGTHTHTHPHLPALVLPAGKAGTAHGLRSPAQRWWLRRFRTHARLGSFQAFSRTLDASSADAVHTSQGSGADPSFLTPREGGGGGGIRSHTMSPSCEFLFSIQKRYLGFLYPAHMETW
jgi:hypothetical protein